ncbi:MAG: ParB/RepB/Spo0J family partition protein [Nitrospira sp. SB0662_bin_26]|nr:ParB/RepB/Spo0J family partition protein [Nitrospira sp. SB0662_bin_26]
MEKKALGKGLAALLPEGEAKETGQAIHMIPVGQIVPNRHQPRKTFVEEELRELVESVKQHGILQPVLVRRKGEDRYELIAGERRFRAAKSAQLPAVPAVIRKSNDDESTILSLIENIQRSNLNPVEEAKAYRQLIDELGMTQEAVAERVGRDRASVANFCRLLSLPQEVQGMVASGRLTLGHAKVILGIKISEDQLTLAKRILRDQLSVRQVEQLVKKRSGKAKSRPAAGSPVHTDVADRLRKHLGTKVVIRSKRSGGELVLTYYSRDDLTRIVDVILS